MEARSINPYREPLALGTPMGWVELLAFKERKDIELQSKKGESLSRYFPELIAALGRLKSKNV